MIATALLEREDELRRLDEALRDAAQGCGRVVLVSGEAGIGKTTLVRAFAARVAGQVRVLVGGCDDLVTPRTLGPFRDMAAAVPGPLADALTGGGPRDALFAALHDELARRTTVLVVEDAQWADDATLDVVRYLAWRVVELPCLLVLTCRDDDAADDHARRRVLGALARQPVCRLPLRGLSPRGVAALSAGRTSPADDADTLFLATNGNPFFVHEVLASLGPAVPATVRDAVLARLDELGNDTRRALQVLAVVPGGAERWLVDRLLEGGADALDEAERHGVLESDVGSVRFRHEIVRRTVEEQLSASLRVDCHRRVLAALLPAGQVELSRLAHHAHHAGDAEKVLQYGLSAAREAAAAGAYSEALSHYELVLSRAELLPGAELAEVLAESVWVLYTVARFGPAAARAAEVVVLCEQLGDRAGTGGALTALSRMLYMVNEPGASEAAVRRAIALLEPREDRRLARAYSYLAAILKLTDRLPEAIALAGQALELARRTGQPDVVAHSLNYLGCALLDLGDPAGADRLRQSVAIARAAHHHEYAQRGWTNLVEGLTRLGRLGELDGPIREGLAYAREFGFTSHEYNIEAHRCMLLMLRGRWEQAEAGLRGLLVVEDPGVLATFGLAALGRLLARTGDPAAGELLDRAWQGAVRTGSVQAVALAGIARVEAAWLAGDDDAAREYAVVPLQRTAGRGAEAYRGELLRYLARVGEPVSSFPGCPPAYAAGIAGDWRAAAQAWRTAGVPYECALELLASGRVDALLEAVAALEQLGAHPAADLARSRLRA